MSFNPAFAFRIPLEMCFVRELQKVGEWVEIANMLGIFEEIHISQVYYRLDIVNTAFLGICKT